MPLISDVDLFIVCFKTRNGVTTFRTFIVKDAAVRFARECRDLQYPEVYTLEIAPLGTAQLYASELHKAVTERATLRHALKTLGASPGKIRRRAKAENVATPQPL